MKPEGLGSPLTTLLSIKSPQVLGSKQTVTDNVHLVGDEHGGFS